MIYKSIIKPLMFDLEAEKAHETAMNLGKIASRNTLLRLAGKSLYNFSSSRLSQTFWGLDFRNPIGLAAGFDKNGEITEIIEAIGFGFTEVGSITANPSTGNPRPRAFRLESDQSLINRMGLNNDGAQTIVRRLEKKQLGIPLGVNIAKTHDPEIVGDKAIQDYLFSFREAHKVADYITVNISCPNTTEGKTFEDPGALDELLAALNIKEDASAIPTLVKFSVDLDRSQLEALLDICEQHRVNGYVATNTSNSREGLHTDANRLKEVGRGGLSGHAICARSTQIIRWISEITNGQKPIIGVGGINSFETALEKIRAGADLLQIYTGLVYEGPGLIKRINKKLDRHLKEHHMDSIHQLEKMDK
ncbi:quinone-dependent dihydroorotate dehydrogenase [Aliifodinibius sp. S!AR15-10]|uniref:quinone-dependent dihydroorotate dehydrogenase n=1 Tax=Aliifodinibius sp. S!AR15-10 TaxID=2950437 RepID=UPI002854935E|nr:quinone-dependent dihydroorotate dehydrogenase [Aliifodinibius sp. S!AR15-10]MDR8392747.1 quinone-dependent dihydroorotate dehydrogenase [Aliifodinibius sp. S!AR15-10]